MSSTTSGPPRKRGLDVVARALFGPLLSGALPGGWRVVSWDAEQGLTLTLQQGESAAGAILVELEDRNDARDCFARTRRFNVCARRLFAAQSPIRDEERQFLERVVRLVRAAEGQLPIFSTAPPAGPARTAIREVLVDRALIPEAAGHYYFNPYAGCLIGCPFCYVAERADLSRRLEGLPSLPWGRYLDIKVNAAEVMAREVRSYPPGIVRMSPILTDPYQPVEKRYRITRQCLEVLCEAGFTPVILTRAARVRDDLDLLSRFPRAAVGFSIPTDDDRLRAIFEPGADPIDERLDALEACHRAGITTFAVIQPMLPMNAERLVARIAPFVRVVRIDRMHQVERSQKLYEAAGATESSTPAFFEETERTLRQGFASHGVPIDDHDDLERLLGAAMGQARP